MDAKSSLIGYSDIFLILNGQKASDVLWQRSRESVVIFRPPFHHAWLKAVGAIVVTLYAIRQDPDGLPQARLNHDAPERLEDALRIRCILPTDRFRT
jgi:hypothetical protein